MPGAIHSGATIGSAALVARATTSLVRTAASTSVTATARGSRAATRSASSAREEAMRISAKSRTQREHPQMVLALDAGAEDGQHAARRRGRAGASPAPPRPAVRTAVTYVPSMKARHAPVRASNRHMTARWTGSAVPALPSKSGDDLDGQVAVRAVARHPEQDRPVGRGELVARRRGDPSGAEVGEAGRQRVEQRAVVDEPLDVRSAEEQDVHGPGC